MKKLMMLCVALAAAIVAQGAAFSWASTANGTDGSGNVLTSKDGAATFVLAYLGTTDSYSFDSAVAVQTGTWTIGSSKGKANAKVSGTYDGSNAANGGVFANGQVYAVMVQTDDGLVAMNPAAPIYTVSGYSGATWSGSAYTFATGNYVADKASYSGGGGDVPEPTSGLLLLIGGAMMALRRKQK